MMLYFKTKTDINGNTYSLEIDTNNKTVTDANLPQPDAVVVSRRKLHDLMTECINDGYKAIYRIYI